MVDAGEEARVDADDAADGREVADEPLQDADDGSDWEDGFLGDDGEESQDGDEGDDGDAGPDGPWPWCPDASAYHGDTWDWTIRAERTAVRADAPGRGPPRPR